MVSTQLRSHEAWHRKADSRKDYKCEDTELEVTSILNSGQINLAFRIEPQEVENTEVGVTIHKRGF